MERTHEQSEIKVAKQEVDTRFPVASQDSAEVGASDTELRAVAEQKAGIPSKKNEMDRT